MQAKLAEQSKGLSPEMLAKFMSLQSPMLQGMMGNYSDQSRGVFEQMQEQMQKQAEQMFGAFGLKR
jgi:polyhydroxyalkanoate synthesis regulator protein